MPRIDPLQLLKCLQVLLSPDGGILSRDEVPRLVNLMTKFSKKLVSKCVYVLILKNTETSLVDMFMAEGGWTLVLTWLQDGVQSANWDLVKEILGLLLITPVDVERLKMNCLPKLIKNLSRKEELGEVANLSNQIVQKWLTIVKGTHNAGALPPSAPTQPTPTIVPKTENEVAKPLPVKAEPEEKVADKKKVTEPKSEESDDVTDNKDAIKTTSFYKVAIKDGKQSVRKISSEEDKSSNASDEDSNKSEPNEEKDAKPVEKSKEKTSKSSSSTKSKSSSSSRDKEREKDKKKSSSSSSSSSSKKKSSSSSKEKDKDKRDKDKERDRKDKDKDKDRSKSSSSSKSSSKSSSSSSKDKKESKSKSKSSDAKDSKEIKEKQVDKDKDTLEKVKPPSLDKLGRIPKKSSSLSTDEKQKENKFENKAKEVPEVKKPSFSILNRKNTGEERGKTVKVFNAKMRSTGLEEEAKPPPPRGSRKPTPSVQLPTIPPKRPSPPRDHTPSLVPPEKKIKIDKVDIPERPGAIKLIPPKPKPAVLQESDMFMDALAAAAPKKEAKKRKRRPSVTKDAPAAATSPPTSPNRGDQPAPSSPTPTSPTTTLGLKEMAPINFYQDTMSGVSENNREEDANKETAMEENSAGTDKDVSENAMEYTDTPASPSTPSQEIVIPMETNDFPPTRMEGGLKGVLLYTKKKGPKRSIRWKAEDDLVEVRYFELDETERVNVTKNFVDMAKMDISSEREALIMSRKLANEDTMEAQIPWRMLYICETPEHLAPPGCKSLEKDIQFAREKTVLAAFYFDKRRIPDSPEEPIPENHQMSDPVIIPLEDPESQEIDLRNTPWPEPKGSLPQYEPQPMPQMYPNVPFNPNFNNMAQMGPAAPYGAVPQRFPGVHAPMAPAPGNFGQPNMMHNNMMVPPISQPEMINPAMYGPTPDGFVGPMNDPNYPVPQFNAPEGPNMNNMYGPGHNYNNYQGGGRGGGRGGGFRRGGGGNSGGWVQMNGPRNNWKRGGGRGGRLCKNIQNHGYCRNGDNCPFVH